MADLRTSPYRTPRTSLSSYKPRTSLFGNDDFTMPKFNQQSEAAQRRAFLKTQANVPGGDSLFGMFGDLFGNLLGDVKDTAVGLIPGLWATAQHPIAAVENIAAQYKSYYGPLFSGDIDTFSSNVQQHPLQLILDALPVAAVAGKAVAAGRVASGVAPITHTFEAGVGRTKIPLTQTLSLDPYKAGWQRLGAQVTKRVPASTPIVGASNRLSKEATKTIEFKERRLSGLHQRGEHMISKLSIPEREAAQYIKEGNTDPALYRQYLAGKRTSPLAEPLKNEEINRVEGVIAQYMRREDSVTKRLDPVIENNRAANALTAEIHGLDPQAARWRDLRPAIEVRDIHGARPRLQPRESGVGVARVTTSRAVGAAEPRATGTLKPHFAGIKNAKVRATVRKAFTRLSKTDRQNYLQWAKDSADNPDTFYQVIDRGVGTVTLQGMSAAGERSADVFVIPASLARRTGLNDMRANYLPQIDQIVQETTGVDPTYSPHRPYDLAEFGPTATSRSSMSLFRRGGNMADVGLSLYDMQSGLKRLRVQTAHEFLRANGRKLQVNEPVPRGWVFVKGEEAVKSRLEFDPARAAEERGPDALKEEARHLWDTVVSEERPKGEAIIVPRSLAKNLENRLLYTHGSMAQTVEAFNSVWKKLILSLTPRFITTNVAGNAFLYGINHPTWMPEIARTYVRRLFHDGGIDVGAETGTLYDHFPQHTKGMGVEERVADIMASPRKRRYNRISGVGYYIVGYTEEAQREALMVKLAMSNKTIKGEVQRLINEGHVGTREKTTLNQAMENVFATDEGVGIYREISDEMDRVMGDYRNYSKWERNVRMLSPFYGWLRHILRTTGSMLSNAPIGLTAIEAVSSQAPDTGGLPDFMSQYISLGDPDPDSGIAQFIDTKPYNPFATIADEVAAARGALTGQPGDLPEGSTSIFGPLPAGLMEYVTGQSLLTGAPVKDPWPGGIISNVVLKPLANAGPLSILRAMASEQPFVDANTSKYTASGARRKPPQHLLQRSPENALLSWLGIPYKEADLDVAMDMGRAERGETKPRSSGRKLNQFGNLGVLNLGR